MARGKPERYSELAKAIENHIAVNGLRQGSALPSERKLADMLGANHLTVRRALRLLAEQERIHTIPSRGNYVGKRTAPIRQTGLIGILVPAEDPFFLSFLCEFEAKCERLNLHPILHVTNGDPAKEKRIISFFKNTDVVGLVVAPTPGSSGIFVDFPGPIVFFDVFIEGAPFPQVIVDDAGGAQKAVSHLLDLGHRRIAYIGGTGDSTCIRRQKGYMDALRGRGLSPDPNLVKEREYSRDWGYYASRELTEDATGATAIFCASDSIAAGVLRYFRESGIDCPKQISVIGFGNTIIAEDLNLTTVTQPCGEMADAILRKLQSLLEGGKLRSTTVLKTELVVRGTSSRVPSIPC
jgi:LacI family transcriptional regulator